MGHISRGNPLDVVGDGLAPATRMNAGVSLSWTRTWIGAQGTEPFPSAGPTTSVFLTSKGGVIGKGWVL